MQFPTGNFNPLADLEEYDQMIGDNKDFIKLIQRKEKKKKSNGGSSSKKDSSKNDTQSSLKNSSQNKSDPPKKKLNKSPEKQLQPIAEETP